MMCVGNELGGGGGVYLQKLWGVQLNRRLIHRGY